MAPRIDQETCTQCRICYDCCPGDVYGLTEGGEVFVKYGDECWHCGCCQIDCPEEAIDFRFPEELLAAVRSAPFPGLTDYH